MKTIQDFIKEIEGSAELQAELDAIKDDGALAAFLKEHDVDGTVEDFGKAIQAQAEAEGEITDDAAKDVVGGFFPSSHYKPALKRLEIEKNTPQIRE